MTGSQTVEAGPLGRHIAHCPGDSRIHTQAPALHHSITSLLHHSITPSLMGIEMRRRQGRRILLPSLLLLVLMIGGVQANMKLCGRKLPETLSKLCVYGFNAMTKRTLDPVNFNLIDGFEDRFLLERLLSDSSVQMLKTRRLRDGVFDECCLKSCSRDEVLRYCATKPRT